MSALYILYDAIPNLIQFHHEIHSPCMALPWETDLNALYVLWPLISQIHLMIHIVLHSFLPFYLVSVSPYALAGLKSCTKSTSYLLLKRIDIWRNVKLEFTMMMICRGVLTLRTIRSSICLPTGLFKHKISIHRCFLTFSLYSCHFLVSRFSKS